MPTADRKQYWRYKDGNQARLENYLRAASPDPTNSPWVSEDDLSV